MIVRRIISATIAATLFTYVAAPSPAAGNPAVAANPDFTQGDKIPEGATHDWNLGPTGARGWMFSDKMLTADARQIAITKVESNSPADGILANGDVILGVGRQLFSYDPRTELGKAITVAESEVGGGNLSLTRWRAGKTENVVVKLPVLGVRTHRAVPLCKIATHS